MKCEKCGKEYDKMYHHYGQEICKDCKALVCRYIPACSACGYGITGAAYRYGINGLYHLKCLLKDSEVRTDA